MSYASIVEVYGKDFGQVAANVRYPMSELLGAPQKQLPGHEQHGDPLSTNSVKNVTPPVHTRVNTRHHAPVQPAPSTHAEPGKYPGYLTKGLPATQYKALEKYDLTGGPRASVYGPSHIKDDANIKELGASEYAKHPLYSGELPCDVDNYPCEAYLTHFEQCPVCQQKAVFVLENNKNNKEGFIGGLLPNPFDGENDSSDVLMYAVIGIILYYLFFRKK